MVVEGRRQSGYWLEDGRKRGQVRYALRESWVVVRNIGPDTHVAMWVIGLKPTVLRGNM